ncbi:phosphate acetyltransferase [Roseibium denhamense]|uniref:phosphate acetyltransferase n=1 Tax=Roseibium denhamense TaxID=76305 RepID=UPI0012BCC206|nr:phosphate acetyltransferase [Roseibium denhamense]MTI05049.1 phosphate acetyltransferase [Roseibium denhamense]
MTLKLGDRANVTRIFTSGDMDQFCAIAGTGTKPPGAVPGPLIGGLFSYLLGVELPGRGTNYLKQDLEFLPPAPIEEELTASVKVTRIRPDKHLVDLKTICQTASGEIICRGRALVYVEDVGKL